jgi:integrase/recombinase XerC
LSDQRDTSGSQDKNFPTLEQGKHVIVTMPNDFEIERRNRALIAFTLLTGSPDSAIASMKLNVDLVVG